MLEFARGVERIDVDHGKARAQHRGGRYRILQDVRHHQRDARALLEPLALQKGRERQRHLVEIAIADRLVHADECLAVAELGKAFFQQLDERGVLGHIDIAGHAGRILLEPDSLHGISPLVYTARSLGRDGWFWAVLSNAAAEGKRQRVVDASIRRFGRVANRSAWCRSCSWAWRPIWASLTASERPAVCRLRRPASRRPLGR